MLAKSGDPVALVILLFLLPLIVWLLWWVYALVRGTGRAVRYATTKKRETKRTIEQKIDRGLRKRGSTTRLDPGPLPDAGVPKKFTATMSQEDLAALKERAETLPQELKAKDEAFRHVLIGHRLDYTPGLLGDEWTMTQPDPREVHKDLHDRAGTPLHELGEDGTPLHELGEDGTPLHDPGEGADASEAGGRR
jgi:hypothetical protein